MVISEPKKFSRGKKLGLILGFLSAGTMLGFLIGHVTSPDASKPGTARWCVVMYGQWQMLDEKRGRIRLRAGGRIYSYATGDSSVTIDYLSAPEIASNPVPKYDFDSDLEKMIALAAAPPVETGIWA